MVNLGKIKDLCEANNITIRQLANDLDLSERAVHLMMSQNTTKIATLDSIAKYFDVEITYFFTSKYTDSRKFTEGILASINFKVVYDIWILFRAEEEALIVKSEKLNRFLETNITSLSLDSSRDDIFSRAFNNESIQRLYNGLDEISEPFACEFIEILKDLINETYVVLKNGHSMKSFIEGDFIKKQNVEAVLNTYFVEFSILGKFYEMIIDNNSNYRV